MRPKVSFEFNLNYLILENPSHSPLLELKNDPSKLLTRYMSYKRSEYVSCDPVTAEFRNNKPYRYKKGNLLDKPFERSNERNTLLSSGYQYTRLNKSHKSSNKVKRVHNSIFNSNSKIISAKSKPAKCRINLAKEIFRNMRKSLKTHQNQSFSDEFSCYSMAKVKFSMNFY